MARCSSSLVAIASFSLLWHAACSVCSAFSAAATSAAPFPCSTSSERTACNLAPSDTTSAWAASAALLAEVAAAAAAASSRRAFSKSSVRESASASASARSLIAKPRVAWASLRA
eukprot:scaffold10944_cov28-Tisochrysis_lutea.AAC.3